MMITEKSTVSSRIMRVGADWLKSEVSNFTDTLERLNIIEHTEKYRFLPQSVTRFSGPMSFDVNPFMKEPAECMSIESPVREVNFKKGVQVTFTTFIESVVFYYAEHIGNRPMMYITADKELATSRIENNFIPMFEQSGFADIYESSDSTSANKTGKTRNHLQFRGGGFLLPFGANNAAKFRQTTIMIMLKDEIDGWPLTVGRDGDPDALSDDRCAAVWPVRKILRGSTPLITGVSKIDKAFDKGDKREYFIRCRRCGFSQFLKWRNERHGFKWDYKDNGKLDFESVRYECINCGHPHVEHDKDVLFATEHGAEWKPTDVSNDPTIRSYHLPAFYSPVGMQPWSKCVSQFLECYNPNTGTVIDVSAYQVFINNVCAESFEVRGYRVRMEEVSAHRRPYAFGQVPNAFAEKYAGSKIKFITCQVDVHDHNLAVAVMGWCEGNRSFLLDYWRYEDNSEEGCLNIESPTWHRLADLIENKVYVDEDKKEYNILLTVIDCNHGRETVLSFCSQYEVGVLPILGTPGQQGRRIREFSSHVTELGTLAYSITVDYYKERISPALKRQWSISDFDARGKIQDIHHFNCPAETTEAQLKELTVEHRRKKVTEEGKVTYYWHRATSARNELWDLLVYGHAAVDIIAHNICIEQNKMESVDWRQFWDEFA